MKNPFIVSKTCFPDRGKLSRQILFSFCGMLLFSWAARGDNGCVSCHQAPDFLVTNKKLYEYYQDWEASVHQQEGVSCVDCHGGLSDAGNKEDAHGKDIMQKVGYRSITSTCGSCHMPIEEAFRTSEHFQQIVVEKQEKLGPTCISCHASINSTAIHVNQVRSICSHCHNRETEIAPEVPAQSEKLLNRFLSIHRYYRYIVKRGDPEEVKSFFSTIDPKIEELSSVWHSFDLVRIDEYTRALFQQLKRKRMELKNAEK